MADSKTSVAGLFCHCRQYGGALGVTLMKNFTATFTLSQMQKTGFNLFSRAYNALDDKPKDKPSDKPADKPK